MLTEDGVPQTIRYCEHQDLTETAKPLPPRTPPNEDITIYNRLVRSQIAPESMDNERYKNRRLLALYFDMTRAAAGRPDARAVGRGAIHAHADDDRGSGGDPALPGRIGGHSAGLYRAIAIAC